MLRSSPVLLAVQIITASGSLTNSVECVTAERLNDLECTLRQLPESHEITEATRRLARLGLPTSN